MQEKVYTYVKNLIGTGVIPNDGITLDIGSFNINGSLKSLFKNYIGLDMRSGPNVDVVSSSHSIPYPENFFDVITCVEMLEHDSNPFQTMKEIHRILKVGGIVVLAASGINFPKHEHPSDYWRFTSEGMQVLLSIFIDVTTFDDNNEAYGYGIK